MIKKNAAARWTAILASSVLLCGCTAGSTQTGTEQQSGVVGAASAELTPAPPSVARTVIGQVLTVEALPFPEPSEAALPASRQQELQQVLDAAVRDSSRVPGVSAAVLTADGAWAGAAGVDGAGAALVPDAMTDIGSVTKTFTAAEVVNLARQGRIDLDAPVSDYLDHPLLAREPSVRQLLSHTSGIPDFVTTDFVDALDADPTRSWTAAQALEFATDPPSQPGPPTWSYSNSNYLLLGLLIEKVTGVPYAAAVRRDLLPGLGERIVVQDDESPIAPVAAPNLTGTPVVADGMFLPNRAWSSAAGAAGGIAADAATLARWGYRLYGGRILDAASTVDLTIPVAGGYGLGTEIQEYRWNETGGAVGHHGGLPGYATVLRVDPELPVAVAVLVPGDPGPDLDKMAKDLLAKIRTGS